MVCERQIFLYILSHTKLRSESKMCGKFPFVGNDLIPETLNILIETYCDNLNAILPSKTIFLKTPLKLYALKPNNFDNNLPNRINTTSPF